MTRSTALAVGIASLLTASAPIAHASDVPNTPENRAREAAKQGPEALRRFIHRTRMIYGLYFGDFVKFDD